MNRPCAECGKELLKPRKADQFPEGAVLFRLVRDRAGKEYPWGWSEKTLAPSVLLCTQCIARLPCSGSPGSVERGVVLTAIPPARTWALAVRRREAVENMLRRYQWAVDQMPKGEAVYSWSSDASCFLVSERLVQEHLAKTWAALQQTREATKQTEEGLNLLGRFLRLLWRRPS